MNDNPIVSIITPTLNSEKFVEKTILSVLNQTYKNIEYIIIDGGSTDGTAEIIKKYEGKIDYWVSEPDKGIYDAMNKGLDAAKGQWIFFLGADDMLYDSLTIEAVSSQLRDDTSVVFGKVRYTNGKEVKSRLNLITLLHNTVHHQSAFYNANLFYNWRYDSTKKLISDYELNLIIYLAKKKYEHMDRFISICSPLGQSIKDTRTAFSEVNAIRKKHLSILMNYILTAFFFLKFSIKK